MINFTEYTVGSKRQDNIPIVHGPIINQINSGLYDAVILFYRVDQPDSAYAQLIRDAYSVSIPDASYLYEPTPTFTATNIQAGTKIIRFIVMYVMNSNTFDSMHIQNALTTLYDSLQNLHVAALNDDQEFGDWEQLFPSLIHCSKLTILADSFAPPRILNPQPLTHSANETAEQ